MQELLRNNGGNMNQVKVENEDENDEIDVEALSDGDEKVDCETGKNHEALDVGVYKIKNIFF